MEISNVSLLTTIVAARPDLMRDALIGFLNAIPRIHIIGVVDDAPAALECARANLPHVIIVDTNLSESNVMPLLRQIDAEMPSVNSIVLADSIRLKQSSLSAGARHALLKGLLDERLAQAVLSANSA